MTFSSEAGMSVPIVTMVLGGALVNGFSPFLTSLSPLVLGSLLGNELQISRAVRGTLLFAGCLGVLWALFGLAASALVNYGLPRFERLPAMLGVGVLLIGLLELKTALAPRGITFSPSLKAWRRIRKHAYRLRYPAQVLGFLLHSFLYLCIFVAAPYLGAITLSNTHLDAGTNLLVLFYSTLFILPFTFLTILSAQKFKLSRVHHWLTKRALLFHLLQSAVLVALGVLLFAGNFGELSW